MKKRFLVVVVHALLIVSLLLLFAAGCAGNKDTDTDKPDTTQAPAIPPQSTFVMDFSDFTENSTAGSTGMLAISAVGQDGPGSATANALVDRSNWNYASWNVGFWNLVGTLGLAIPVNAFVESLKQNPVKQPDNSWVWTYSVTVQFVTYTAELHGKYIDDGVRWDMYISKQNGFEDYPWYCGESDFGGTEGFWVLKAEQAKGTDLLQIDWHRDPARGTGDITYTNIVPGGPENGGFISFVMTDDEPYDRSYTIFNKSGNQTTYIEWDSTTKAGRVKDSKHFSDEIWHCWDATLVNAACAE